MASISAFDDAWAAACRAARELLHAEIELVASDADIREADLHVVLPLRFAGQSVGAILAHFSGEPTLDDRAALESVALLVAARVVDNERRREAERYERLATSDALTGVANRRSFDEVLAREWSRAMRTREPLALVLLDVDFFKAYNDAYGHTAGDTCLQRVARAAASALARSSDSFARYGGEEFVAILPGTSLAGAIAVAESMRTAIARTAIPHDGSSLRRVSISLGCAAVIPEVGEAPATLLEHADRALYAAKAGGRNRAAADGYAAEGEPASPRYVVRGSLPATRASFFGRATEREELVHALERQPLISLVGPGGVGKTRLAIEVASAALDRGVGSAWFVDLATAQPHDDLVPIVASALRGHVPLCRSAADVAINLRGRKALLVLDNCEHIKERVAAFVDEALSSESDLRILATSREALETPGECVFRVAPLPIVDAIRLLHDRAALAGAPIRQGDDAVLAPIAERLDGIPLAIELVAPRLATMTPQELATGLEQRLGVVQAANRRMPSRQQTLRATFEWSYRLLDDVEATVFRRCAIFNGGFTVDAARAVCASNEISGADVEGAVGRLVAKSLLASADSGATTRISMLETTRSFAMHLLNDSGEVGRIAELHARYFEAFVRRSHDERIRMPMTRWLRAIGEERSNLRASVLWLLDRRDEGTAATIERLCYWYYERGSLYGVEHAQAFRSALEDETLDPHLRAALQLGIASILRRIDARAVRELAAEALLFYVRCADVRAIALTRRVLAFTEFATEGRIDPALEPVLAALVEELTVAGEMTLAADILNNVGILRTQLLDDARLPDALAAFDGVIEILEARGDEDRCGLPSGNSGDVAFYLGDVATAIVRARRAIALLEQAEETWLAGLQHLNLGHFSMWAGDFETSRVSLQRAFEGLQAQHESLGAVSVFDKVAQLARLCAKPDAAALLLGFADAAYRRAGLKRQQREAHYIEAMREDLAVTLGSEYAALYDRGGRLSRDKARAIADAV